MRWFKNNFWILWAILFGSFDAFSACYLYFVHGYSGHVLFYIICCVMVVFCSLMAHFSGKKRHKIEEESNNYVLKQKLSYIKEKYDELT